MAASRSLIVAARIQRHAPASAQVDQFLPPWRRTGSGSSTGGSGTVSSVRRRASTSSSASRDFPLHPRRAPGASLVDNRVVWLIPALDGDLVDIGIIYTEYDGLARRCHGPRQRTSIIFLQAGELRRPRTQGWDSAMSSCSWAGLRPYIKSEGDLAASAGSTPRHEATTSPAWRPTIAGGKTTMRGRRAEHVIGRGGEGSCRRLWPRRHPALKQR